MATGTCTGSLRPALLAIQAASVEVFEYASRNPAMRAEKQSLSVLQVVSPLVLDSPTPRRLQRCFPDPSG